MPLSKLCCSRSIIASIDTSLNIIHHGSRVCTLVPCAQPHHAISSPSHVPAGVNFKKWLLMQGKIKHGAMEEVSRWLGWAHALPTTRSQMRAAKYLQSKACSQIFAAKCVQPNSGRQIQAGKYAQPHACSQIRAGKYAQSSAFSQTLAAECILWETYNRAIDGMADTSCLRHLKCIFKSQMSYIYLRRLSMLSVNICGA